MGPLFSLVTSGKCHVTSPCETRACLEAGMATLPSVGVTVFCCFTVWGCCFYYYFLLLLLLLLLPPLLAWTLLLHGRSSEIHRSKTQVWQLRGCNLWIWRFPSPKNSRASVLSLHTCWGSGYVRLMPGAGVGGCFCSHKPFCRDWRVCWSIFPEMWLHTVLLAPSLAKTRPVNCTHLASV